jgi:hypothetical protein
MSKSIDNYEMLCARCRTATVDTCTGGGAE